MNQHPSVEIRIWTGLNQLIQTIRREAIDDLADFGVLPSHFYILNLLSRRGALQQREIAAALGVTAPNVSQLIRKLESVGHVQRVRKARSQQVHLTQQGTRLVETLRPRHQDFFARRFEALSPEERMILAGLLERLNG